MAIRVIILVVFGILSLAWIGFLIWLLSLIIRALLKYLKTEDVRKEKAVVSKWENGTSDPSTSNLFALAKLFGISVEELLRDIG